MTAVFDGPSLSCTSSSATMSGARRLSTIRSASRANFAAGSTGDRFSTLNVAIASSLVVCGRVTSRARPLSTRASAEVNWSSKFPKL